ncbi:MAG TPA: ATP-dependent Clp protease adaptor ClpS [Phycisphaerae bacterium]|mgnify:CR=1 FL=1|nr:ATP-dependent Clp protease adaptor ClpS [Phycisphaerae bacterium]HOJ73684.1 ATP-dependent Clp protease adaptor ClpS [Phycisphaerae bacterium]HOM50331.1 ATP-dependent Clp protease adaptor ClpS [Phycisphaerae bacterium]HON65945.1 ATP-dependent Clp protease adaptor ClpS [Phycisphaerae bacterium]HOQ84958.1 ATP-dependent Clp protease adaptor ClpS [Phycisphaerae bacterium]
MTERNEHEPMGEETGASSSSAKSLPRKAASSVTPRSLPPWRVILHNDNVNYIDDVVKVLQKLTPLTKEDAVSRVMEAQNQGLSLLLVTHQERAELYVEQFASCNIKVTAEPAT